MVVISASVFSADLTQLRHSVENAQRFGAGCFHVDVLDGHFVPYFGFNAHFTEELQRCTHLPIDVHLQTQNPQNYIEQFMRLAIKSITFHIEEAPEDVIGLLQTIQRRKIRAGIAICPDTPVSKISQIIPFCDSITVLSVHPGYTGEKFLPVTLEKIKEIRKTLATYGSKIEIAVDGEIQENTGRDCIAAGADKLVIGKAFFQNEHPEDLVKVLLEKN